MKKEFEEFYRVLIPNLNECGNCGVTKCFYCTKFTVVLALQSSKMQKLYKIQ